MKTFAKPLLCWLTAIAGLVLALLTDGLGDALAIALLCVPLAVLVQPLVRSSSSPR